MKVTPRRLFAAIELTVAALLAAIALFALLHGLSYDKWQRDQGYAASEYFVAWWLFMTAAAFTGASRHLRLTSPPSRLLHIAQLAVALWLLYSAYIPGDLGVHEPIQDVAGYLQNWFSMFVIRAQRHEDLLEVAARSTVPVINARTDRGHPCEVMGDLLYLRQLGRDLGALKLVFVGEPSNLCMSWLEAAAVFPMRVVQVCPPGHEISASSLEALRSRAAGHISVTHDLRGALNGADVIYTDCWPEAKTADDRARVRAAFLPYQITVEHLAALGECGVLPAMSTGD